MECQHLIWFVHTNVIDVIVSHCSWLYFSSSPHCDWASITSSSWAVLITCTSQRSLHLVAMRWYLCATDFPPFLSFLENACLGISFLLGMTVPLLLYYSLCWKTPVHVNGVASVFTSVKSLLTLKELLKSVSSGFVPAYTAKVLSLFWSLDILEFRCHSIYNWEDFV
jgi:hypothetical protein